MSSTFMLYICILVSVTYLGTEYFMDKCVFLACLTYLCTKYLMYKCLFVVSLTYVYTQHLLYICSSPVVSFSICINLVERNACALMCELVLTIHSLFTFVCTFKPSMCVSMGSSNLTLAIERISILGVDIQLEN